MRQTNRTFKIEKRGERRPMKPPAWSHQKDLETLRGKKIKIVFIDGTWATGELLQADQFTLQIVTPGIAENHQSSMTYFKHAIRSYKEYLG